MSLMLVGAVVEARQHGPAAAALADLAEAVALVEAQRRVVRLDAERDLPETVPFRLREQGSEQLFAVALPTPRRHDGDRQLGRLLVDEAVARLALLEEPVPRGTDVSGVVVGDHGGVAGAAPAHDVALHGSLHRIQRCVLAPVVRVVEHVAQEARVVATTGADHETRSCASWMRLPSGSYTSSRRTWPCSSSTVPTFTPSPRKRSASAFTSSTSTCPTPPSSGSPSATAISISPRRILAHRSCQSTYVSSNPSSSR